MHLKGDFCEIVGIIIYEALVLQRPVFGSHHRLNGITVDLQSLFGLHVYSCTQWLRPIEIDTLEYQQTEKIETEQEDVDRIGYESGKCTLDVQGGILGGHKSAPVSHKHMLSQPSFSSPLINEDLPARGRAAACVYFK